MIKIKGNMIVGHILDKYTGTLDVFLKFGLTHLKDPANRKTIAYKVTIEKASKLHNIDLEELLLALNSTIE